MPSNAQLKQTVDALEAQNVVRPGNDGPEGLWRRIALAAEGIAGVASAANETTLGFMLRTAKALELTSGTSGAEENMNFAGLLKRIVDALEKGAVGPGSLSNRLVIAAQAFTVSDLYYTKLLMGFEGADAAQVFVDESPVARTGFTFDVGSSVATAIAQKKFGNSSLTVPTADDWLKLPDSDDWYFGTGPFTIELWHRPDAIAGSRQLIGQNQDLNGGAVNASWVLYEFNGVIQFAFHDAGLNDWRTVAGGASSVLATWVHTRVDRDLTGKVRLYRDGVMVGSYTYPGEIRQVATALTIGAAADGSADYLGFVDELRIMKGRAACGSDAGFAVPAAPYPRV